jgi:hypothetical protein
MKTLFTSAFTVAVVTALAALPTTASAKTGTMNGVVLNWSEGQVVGSFDLEVEPAGDKMAFL